MAKPQIVQRSEEAAKETVKHIATGVKNEATESAREAFAQLLGIPPPDKTITEMKQRDSQQTGVQIGNAQQELSQMKNKTKPEGTLPPVAAILRKETGVTHEQAQGQLSQTLHREAQELGQTNENSEERRKEQVRQQEEEEKQRKDQEDRDRLASPIGLPGSHTQSTPVSRPVVNQRQPTGETLKKRDT
ncbi:MAG: hypothetical protein Q7R44_00885 [bacterium]|nr:hypothetical protein [bacterium]